MALDMRDVCERCGNALSPEGEAYICPFECTFCATCTHDLQAICPNCGGELAQRPRRVKAPISSSAAKEANQPAKGTPIVRAQMAHFGFNHTVVKRRTPYSSVVQRGSPTSLFASNEQRTSRGCEACTG